MVQRGEVERVVVEYPNRLARFGFNYLKQFFSAFGVELVIINGNSEEKEKMVELAEDLVAIVTSFAAKYTHKEVLKGNDNSTVLA
jgi:predicted site-specific integrase-resolvase